ncbi:aminotransferase class IV [Cellulomonas sp.]|uniref:aminotransferase class IV n=1 Tax=Cellulomonas sp. TaxID=40001 RepID=UPI0028111121|nr:aminotransferase class IV [Cellulomonas sp.]
MSAAPPAVAWLNGRVVDWADCTLHARSPGAFWGANVFEGLRAYWDEDAGTSRVFRLEDHLARLHRSMRALHLRTDHGDDELVRAVEDVLAGNDFRADAHVVVVVYVEAGATLDALQPTELTGVHVTAVPFPRGARYRTGLDVGVSSWRRIAHDVMPPRVKAGANYHNGRLAHHESVRNGYDTALLLNQRGTVAEGPGSCVVMVSDGQLVTPPASDGALDSLTVDTVSALAAEHLGLPTVRRPVDRTELLHADEVLLAGTLVEVQPVVSVDRVTIGDGLPGPVTRSLQDLYDAAARYGTGRPGWTHDVPVTTGVGV